MEDSKPFHDFGGLSKLLDSLNYPKVDLKPFTLVMVSLQEAFAEGKISFDEEGIKYNYEGQSIVGFVYKKSYNIEKYGKPRFHITNCKTIQDFRDRNRFDLDYFWSSVGLVDVIDTSKQKLLMKDVDLPICGYCQKLTNEPYSTSKQFEVNFEKTNFHNTSITKSTVETDVNGYVKDWEQISRSYREEAIYRCESCNYKPSNPMYNRFMHVHHIDAIKTNNIFSNLKCLCIECHSQVDDSHRQRFSSGGSLIELKAFKASKSR